tara:strand:- start:384 stop:824 length:441 start_codon:yes stop_codon:yes gene_type:complete
MNLIKEFFNKKILSLIWQQNGTPYFKAKGTAAGVFSGCFPFFGFQTFLGVFLARIIKGNLVLAAIGTWISNPFTYIPLYLLNFKVGSFILNDDTTIIVDPTLLKDQLWQQGWLIISRLIIGSAFIGLVLGLITGVITYYLVKITNK